MRRGVRRGRWLPESQALSDAPGPDASFYDDDAAVREYLDHRNRPVFSPNLVMETPAFSAAAGPLRDQRILDLGCGDGRFAMTCLAGSCKAYIGVDRSVPMVDRARAQVDDPRATFVHARLEAHEFIGPYDLITARMSLHYLADIDPVLERARRALDDDGRFIVSVVHPAITASRRPPDPNAPRGSVIIDDYFERGPRDRRWFDRPVTWHHRTIEEYVGALVRADFTIDHLSECEPDPPAFEGDTAELERRRRAPLFLLLRGRPV